MGISHLKALLRKQTKLLADFAVKETELQNAVVQRDWSAMDRTMPELDRLSAALETVERRRHSAVDRLKKGAGLAPDSPFAELVTRGSDADRAELTTLFRDLQVAVLRVRNHTRGIDSYVRNSIRTTNTVLGEIFPDRKGTIYSRSGSQSPIRGSAMVLDREL